MRKYLLVSLILICSSCLFAQDRMLLMSGKELDKIKVNEITANTVTYQHEGSASEHKIYRENVFSVSYANGTEKVLYMPLPEENDLDAEQMRMFLRGTQDARVHYKNYSSYFIGFVSGVAGPILASYSLPPIIAFPPATGIFLSSLSSPNMANLPYVDKKLLNNEEYMMGFQRKARAKKIRNAFFGSLVGVAATLVFMESQK